MVEEEFKKVYSGMKEMFGDKIDACLVHRPKTFAYYYKVYSFLNRVKEYEKGITVHGM